jgi:hypothetical protein
MMPVDSDPCAVCLERQCTVAAEGLWSPDFPVNLTRSPTLKLQTLIPTVQYLHGA